MEPKMKLLKIFLFSVLMAGLILSLGCGSPPEPESKVEEAEPAAKSVPPPKEAEPEAESVEVAKLEAPKPEPPKPPPPPKPKVKEKPVVVMETSKGTIKIELDEEKAPGTVANFLQYVDDKFYDGTIFHRVMPNFMIQGGGFGPDMNEKSTRETIKNEATNGLANLRGTIAMARRPDPHSASSQFFINHKTNQALDKENSRDGWGYCVFGKVTEGLDVVDAIAQVPTGNKGGHGNVPTAAVTIKTVRREE
jgi:cyclophilin family peptidyl-prolyl cis-trans isomerase